MRYYGFSTRQFIILDNVTLNRDRSLLEIGIGLGAIIEATIGKVKEYYGFDISCGLINYLNSLYAENSFVNLYCFDVCKGKFSLDKRFDIVVSSDTLEHVECPHSYFSFIKNHINFNGIVLITFPNESKIKHHGVTWFDSKKDLSKVINGAGLEIVKLMEVKKTLWHMAVRKFLWDLPKSIVQRKNTNAQVFDETEAFGIIKSNNIRIKVLAFYARAVTRLALLFPLFKYSAVEGEDIVNKRLLLFLKCNKN